MAWAPPILIIVANVLMWTAVMTKSQALSIILGSASLPFAVASVVLWQWG